MEKVLHEVGMDFGESEILGSVDPPLHVVPHPGVETGEVLLGDDVVIVQIQDMVEEVTELLLLEVRDERPTLGCLFTVIFSSLNEGAPGMLYPPRLDNQGGFLLLRFSSCCLLLFGLL